MLTIVRLLVALVGCSVAVAMDWQWRVGRASNYGGAGDPWTIHAGSCSYQYLDPSVNKGWDVAALADAVSDYTGSCGRCYEVGCQPMHLTDGYGAGLDRTNVCYDSSQTVTLMITDTCPCNYPPNYYSNKRWCCGDYYHFDISSWTFEKLADRKYGVIGIRYREVPCNYCPDKEAQLPAGQSPSAPVQAPPSGWSSSQDKRPVAKMCAQATSKNEQQSSPSPGLQPSPTDPPQQQDSQSTDSQGGKQPVSLQIGGSNAPQPGSFTNLAGLFGGSSFLSNFQDISYNLRNSWTVKGPDGQNSYCGVLDGWGAIAFQGTTGTLVGKNQLTFDVQADSNGNLPNLALALSSTKKGSCRTIDLQGLPGAVDRGTGWQQLSIPLININWDISSWQQQVTGFGGCSSSIGAWDVDKLEFKSKIGSSQSLCIANIQATTS